MHLAVREASFASRFLRRFLRGGRIGHFLGGAEHAALVSLGDQIIARLFTRQYFLGVNLAVVLRLVAEAIGVRVVVPGALVPRDAVDDLELDLRVLDADGDELRQVARAEPDGKAPLIEWPRADVADAHHEHLHAVLVGVQAAERLAEHLGDAVAAVGLRIDAVIDRLIAAIKADGVVARRKDDSPDAVPARRFEHVVTADDVRLQDRLPGPLDRVAAEMHHCVDALGDAQRVGHPGDVGTHEAVALRRLQRPPVGEPQPVFVAELAREMRADVARGTRNQHRLHRNLPSASLNSAARSKYTEWPAAGTRSAWPCGASAASSGPAIGGNTQSSSPVMKSTGIARRSSSAGERVRSSRRRWRTCSRKAPSASSRI